MMNHLNCFLIAKKFPSDIQESTRILFYSTIVMNEQYMEYFGGMPLMIFIGKNSHYSKRLQNLVPDLTLVFSSHHYSNNMCL